MKNPTLPKIPPPPRPARETLSRREQYYMLVLMRWYEYRKEAPTCDQLAALCRPPRSNTAVRSALLSAESKGYVLRNKDGRFEVIP